MVCSLIVQYFNLLVKLLCISTEMEYKIYRKNIFCTTLTFVNNSNSHRRYGVTGIVKSGCGELYRVSIKLLCLSVHRTLH